MPHNDPSVIKAAEEVIGGRGREREWELRYHVMTALVALVALDLERGARQLTSARDMRPVMRRAASHLAEIASSERAPWALR